jgi:predicted dehydrogenase
MKLLDSNLEIPVEKKHQDRLNVAFIGGAYHSAVGRVHRIATEMDQRFKLIAGCFSRQQHANLESADLYGLEAESCYHQLEDLLVAEKPSLDALVVLTPTTQHFDMITTALKCGIPVISEKALVTNLSEALAIESMLKQYNGFLRVTYNYTGYPMLRELKAMIGAGKLGKLSEVHIEMPQEGFAKLDLNGKPIVPQAWRLQDGDIPTVSLDLGVHVHSIVKFLSDADPIELVATSKTYGNFSQITDSVSCIAQYTQDMLCQIWFSKTALGHRNGLKVRVYGDLGAAEWYQDNPEYLHFSDCNGRQSTIDRAHPDVCITNQARYNRFKSGHPAGFIEAFANTYYDLAEELNQLKAGKPLTENPYTFGIEDAKQGLMMLQAMQQSAQDRRWVKLSETA